MASYGLASNPDSKVHGATMGPIWGRQDPGGPHVGPMNLAIWETMNIMLPTVKMIKVTLELAFGCLIFWCDHDTLVPQICLWIVDIPFMSTVILHTVGYLRRMVNLKSQCFMYHDLSLADPTSRQPDATLHHGPSCSTKNMLYFTMRLEITSHIYFDIDFVIFQNVSL